MRIGIIGAGQMGVGIAQVAVQAGYRVSIAELSYERAEAGKAKIQKALSRLVEKKKISKEEAEEVGERITCVDSLGDFKTVDFAVEAVVEDRDLKYKIFRSLDEVLKPEAILATNTSSISITAIAAQTMRPESVVGMHFMNPVPLMKLVEGVRGLRTSDKTFMAMKEVAEKMGKVVVESRDVPAFLVNRILMPMINEAIYALYEGVGNVESIDTSMKLGTNQPMGPLALADFIGLDTCLAILNVIHGGLGDSKYRPCPLLKQYVDAGFLGKKSKVGFYDYRSEKVTVANHRGL